MKSSKLKETYCPPQADVAALAAETVFAASPYDVEGSSHENYDSVDLFN